MRLSYEEVQPIRTVDIETSSTGEVVTYTNGDRVEVSGVEFGGKEIKYLSVRGFISAVGKKYVKVLLDSDGQFHNFKVSDCKLVSPAPDRIEDLDLDSIPDDVVPVLTKIKPTEVDQLKLTIACWELRYADLEAENAKLRQQIEELHHAQTTA